MKNKERKKEITKQPIPTKEECLAFYKELANLADARFVPYYKMAIEALGKEPILDQITEEIRHFMLEINPSSSESDYAYNYILDVINKYKEGGAV